MCQGFVLFCTFIGWGGSERKGREDKQKQHSKRRDKIKTETRDKIRD
jgi:hypothetical protein